MTCSVPALVTAVLLAQAGTGRADRSAHAPPRFRTQAEKHRFLEAYVQKLAPPAGTRVVIASLSGEVDGFFSYLLVVGDEAILNLTRGRPRRVQLPKRGLAEVLARYDAARVASLGSPADEHGGAFMDGGTWQVEFRQGDATAQFMYRCMDCLPLTGVSQETDLIRLLASYVERDWPPDAPFPDLSAEAR